jgi:hypothetical protein
MTESGEGTLKRLNAEPIDPKRLHRSTQSSGSHRGAAASAAAASNWNWSLALLSRAL